MNTAQLKKWFANKLKYRGTVDGPLKFKLGSFNISIITNTSMDRVRIYAEICDIADIDTKDLLNANFHSTQDVNYAIHKGKIYSLFKHYISQLTVKEFDDAFNQVLELARNTVQGDYECGDLYYIRGYETSKKEKGRYENVNQLWGKCLNEKNKNKKGKIFENFVKEFLYLEPGLRKSKQNFLTKNEEMDIMIQNKIGSPYWLMLGSPHILVECKNTRENTEAEAIRNFAGKIENHTNFCKLGLFFSISNFSKGCYTELLRYGRTQVKIALINKNDINEFLKKKFSMREFLEDSIHKSII